MVWLWLSVMAWGNTLTLDQVLMAVDVRVPQLAAAAAELDAAEAKLLATRGAFDPKLAAKGSAYWNKSPRQIIDTKIKGDTLWGPSYWVGYERGSGEFPAYGEESKTGSSGELVVGLDIPVLRGMAYNQTRAVRDAAGHHSKAKAADLTFKRLAIRLKAAALYWKWVLYGRLWFIERQLYQVAEERAEAIDRQVTEGARSNLDALDNQRVLFERRNQLLQAELDTQLAALALSLYYRDAQGLPVIPRSESLPETLDGVVAPRTLSEDLALVQQRPDIVAITSRTAAESSLLKGARNSLLPTLSVGGQVSQPLADDGTTEWIGKLALDMPLLFRKGRGTVQAQAAAVSVISQENRVALDRAEIEVRAAHAAIALGSQQAKAAATAAELALEVMRMERKRFEYGDSDLFVLLQREQKAAKAAMAAAKAQAAVRIAEAELEAVTGVPLGP